ncbi:Glutamate receptor ionotropic [Mactra antiquata]
MPLEQENCLYILLPSMSRPQTQLPETLMAFLASMANVCDNKSDEKSRVLQIAPTIYHQCQAMQKILDRYNWTEFSVLTTKVSSHVDFINCMRNMVKETSRSHGFTTKAKFNILSSVTADIGDEYNEARKNTIKAALRTVQRSVSRVIILHASDTEALDIMEAAEEVGLTNPKYMWLLTASSIGQIAMFTRLPTGILGIMYNNSVEIIEEAIETSIKIWALGLEKIAKDPRAVKSMAMYPSYSCNRSAMSWEDGFKIYQAMKSVVIENPPVSFSDNGVIENVKFTIYNSRPYTGGKFRGRRMNTLVPVGHIVPEEVKGKIGMKIKMDEVVWPGNAVAPPKGKPEKRFFRIVTLKEAPYIIYVPPDPLTGKCSVHAVPCRLTIDPDDPDRLNLDNVTIGKDGMVNYCCTGLCVDLLKILSVRMNFDYEMYEVEDREWGIEENGTWSGLIKSMLDGNADMVITSIKINHQRATAMDFSTPFLETGITIMVALRKGAISATAFLEPYDYPSWCLILVFSVHATGASIFIFEWLSPSGLDKGKQTIREHKFSLFRSFWLIWAMLFGASVSTDNPRGMSSRFLANVWALFALVFLASYTANLAAFMITIDEFYDLSGIQDWRLMNPTAVTPHFRFATIPGGSTEANLRQNYPRMHRYMAKYNKDKLPFAVNALKSGEIHAFIYDATVLEYLAGGDKDCNLITVGKWYAMTGYAVGFPKGSPFIDEVNKIILELQNNGELDRLQKFWLAGACHAQKDKKDKTSHKIGILNFTSAFILLAAGVTLATILLLLEHFYFKFGRRCLKKYDKTGCCALVSLSMGKSLTFEQSVLNAIEYQRSHKCKNPICETQLWKVRHELDLALIKLQNMREELARTEPTDFSEYTKDTVDLTTTEDPFKAIEANGTHNSAAQSVHTIESLYDTPKQLYNKDKINNHVGNSTSHCFHNYDPSRQNCLAPTLKEDVMSDLDKKRLHFRRSPSYTNAISIDSDVTKDTNSLTADEPPTYMDVSPKRCPSYSQAVEESPLLSKGHGDKQNTKTKFFDGKYYVGVVNDSDESAL